jgi:hypothetical protein
MTDQTHRHGAGARPGRRGRDHVESGLLGWDGRTLNLFLIVAVLTMLAPFILNPFPEGSELAQFNAGYPDLMQRFVIFGIFAIGFNILFGLTGYLSFGHAAFLGVGSYAAIWMMKLLTMNVVPAIIMAVIVAGSSRAGGLYLAAALGHLLLDPDAGLRADVLRARLFGADPDHRRRDRPAAQGLTTRASSIAPLEGEGDPRANLFGLRCATASSWNVGDWLFTFNAATTCRAGDADRLLRRDPDLPLALRHDAAGGQVEPAADELHRPELQALHAGGLRDLGHVCRSRRRPDGGDGPLAGAERMFWTASGEVVLMTILGGAGTLIGPVLGAGMIKYMENIFSKINERHPARLVRLPARRARGLRGHDDLPVHRQGLAPDAGHHVHARGHLPARRPGRGRSAHRAALRAQEEGRRIQDPEHHPKPAPHVAE